MVIPYRTEFLRIQTHYSKLFHESFTHGIFYVGGWSYSLIVSLRWRKSEHVKEIFGMYPTVIPDLTTGTAKDSLVIWLFCTRKFFAKWSTPTVTLNMVSTCHNISRTRIHLTSAYASTRVVGISSMTYASTAHHVWWAWCNDHDSIHKIKAAKCWFSAIRKNYVLYGIVQRTQNGGAYGEHMFM